jgi:hypothetical protein
LQQLLQLWRRRGKHRHYSKPRLDAPLLFKLMLSKTSLVWLAWVAYKLKVKPRMKRVQGIQYGPFFLFMFLFQIFYLGNRFNTNLNVPCGFFY